jgi:glucose-1-phosphate thymidylyltransferase
MRAVIPAAGPGSRLRPLTLSVPKCLVPVAGRPILRCVIDALEASGFDETTVVAGHLADSVEEWVRRCCTSRVRVVRQTDPDGIATAVASASGFIDDGPLAVALGDTVFESSIPLPSSRGENWIGVSRVDDPSRYGIVVEGPGGVQKMVEKPAVRVGNLAMAGIYVFGSGTELLGAIQRLVSLGARTRGEFQLTDAMQIMLEGGSRFETFHVGSWHDCGTPAALLETSRILMERAGEAPPPLPGCRAIPPVHVAPGARVERCIIGPNVTIGDGCTVEDSELSDLIAMDGCVIRGAKLHGAILGAGSVLVCGRGEGDG